MSDETTELIDFSYPYKIDYRTFMIHKPQYTPQIFGIFQTLSLFVWIAIISVLIAMSLVYYVALKSNYSFIEVLLHVLAVILRQSSIIKPISLAEKLLLYSWVLGTMFICLAYNSVFLSFLTFPLVTPIKDLSDLANAVKNGEYHC